jgi:putative phage-type endonuclease
LTAVHGFADRAEWLAARRQGIGASESAAILGLNPYQSPAELYLRKLGEMPEQPESWPMKVGTFMEGLLAREYESRYGVNLDQQVFVRHAEHPWMFATLDGVTPDGEVVEFKTAGWRQASEWGEPETDEVPWNYLVQVQHQLEVTRLDRAYVFASIDRADPVRFRVERWPELGEFIADTCQLFWQHVCDRVPPYKFALRPTDARLWHLLHPETEGAVKLGRDEQDIVERRAEIALQMKQLEAERDALKLDLLAALGPFGSGSLPDGRVLTRKRVDVAEQVVRRKAYTFTDLRVKSPKA